MHHYRHNSRNHDTGTYSRSPSPKLEPNSQNRSDTSSRSESVDRNNNNNNNNMSTSTSTSTSTSSTVGPIASRGDGGTEFPRPKRVHFEQCSGNDKLNSNGLLNGGPKVDGYNTNRMAASTSQPGSNRDCNKNKNNHNHVLVEEYKDSNGEVGALRKYLNGYGSIPVRKDVIVPTSHRTRYVNGAGTGTTSAVKDTSTRNRNRNQDQDTAKDSRMYPSDQTIMEDSNWKIPTKNISSITAAVAALLVCIGALLVGVSHSLEKSNEYYYSYSSSSSSSSSSGVENPGRYNSFNPRNMFDEVGRYIVPDFDVQTPYSDFLPGLAGIYGKPLYAFFVNRGQGIASFGFKSKKTPIMEFSPANTAYQNTPLVGFRTFVQATRNGNNEGRGSGSSFLVEPFSPLTTNYPGATMTTTMTKDEFGTNIRVPPPANNKRTMYSGENEMQIQEIDFKHQLETNVTYFILPEEDFGAFVRRVTITNTHPEDAVTVSFLDGLAKMQPAGGDIDEYLKTMGRTLEGFYGVYFPYEDSITMPFYRLSQRPTDSEFVEVPELGHYCVSIMDDQTLLPIVYDTSKVFGEDTTLLRPMELYTKSISDIVGAPQYGKAKTSSCFAAMEDRTLQPNESITITTYYGAANHLLDLPVIVRRLQQEGFAPYKLLRTREVIRQITASVETKTGSEMFDAHVSQMFLDNSLRGGIPIVIGDQDDNNSIQTVDEDPRLKVFHVFSRIHGDLERDYNDFQLPSTFFSQGPGNFRDVAQNRRNDVVFNPKIGSFNVRLFLSFIQADGYEPNSVESIVFTIDDKELCDDIAARAVGQADGHRAQREALSGILNNGPFRPGQLFQLMAEQNIFLIMSTQEFIDMVAVAATFYPFAVYKEGYWADHWTYYLDMIQSYLSIYPEEEERVMFEVPLPYFFSPATVQPRSEKYVKNLSYHGGHDHIQQLGATVEDEAKKEYMQDFFAENIGWYRIVAHWQHDELSGKVFESTAYEKLFLLATLKFATRDALGMGIEYEAGRPGWDDGNNGMPGMLGSGMPEAFELKALIRYLLRCGKKHRKAFQIPEELHELYTAINGNLTALLVGYSYRYEEDPSAVSEDVTVPQEMFSYWDSVSTARERYREQTRITFSGRTVPMNHTVVVNDLKRWAKEIDRGIARAKRIGTRGVGDDGASGIVPTYFAYSVTEWNLTGAQTRDGHPFVTPLSLSVRHFPLFLEGPTRMMKTVGTKAARDIFVSVKNSTLYDKQLRMYTLSASLAGQPVEMGRSTAFAPGWLENQSVWLHMSYKFYLELLRHKLYDDFFDSVMDGGMLPFVDAKTYGRTPMQCSSFIASSAFENPSVRGRGFLGRLSGATAEFLSIWILMFIGPRPFSLEPDTGDLRMQLAPTIPGGLFHIHDGISNMGGVMMDDDGTPRISFKLFSSIAVHYYNPKQVDLMGTPPKRYRVGLRDGSIFEFHQSYIPSVMAEKIRRVVFVDFIEAHF